MLPDYKYGRAGILMQEGKGNIRFYITHIKIEFNYLSGHQHNYHSTP